MATNPRAAKRLPRTPAFSCSHAERYMDCIRRVKDTPENSSSSRLKMLSVLVAVEGVAKSWVTASAESPVRLNLRMNVSEMTSS